MSYSADELIRDLIDKEDGEDVVILIDGDRYLVTGVSPRRDQGCLVLNVSKTIYNGWHNHEIGDHMRRRHGFEGPWAGSLPDGRRERLAQHDLDHRGGAYWAGQEPLGHRHPHPDNMAEIEEV